MKPEEVHAHLQEMGRLARQAALALATLTAEQKNAALQEMASALRSQSPAILEANARDLTNGQSKGLTVALLDRLRLDNARLDNVASGIEKVATLPDPIGETLNDFTRPNGLRIRQVRVPIGVIGIIYESRPNVTADAAVLCLKSGNATILRGGSEALHSNLAIAEALQSGAAKAGLPENSIQLVPFTDRESVAALACMDESLDLLIPRGGRGLIEAVVSLARMPVIKHYDGICHTFIDRAASLPMALALTVDAKTQKPGVCNALETLLVHRNLAPVQLPLIAQALRKKEVELRACPESLGILEKANIPAIPATNEDWDAEYLDLILAIKTVPSLSHAIAHINRHGSRHSDCIVTDDLQAADRFLREVDSACVYHNASTRFSDGEEFGFGAEIGISTDKIHARGPMALRELTSYQYRIQGSGQIKASPKK